MAVDMFLVIDGVKGETSDSSFKDKGGIDVLAWSWGVSNSGSAHIGGGRGSGKANVQDLSVTKYIDKSSTSLLLSCCTGKHYDKATLTVRKAGDKPLEYLVINLEEVLVSSVSTGGSGGEDRLTENVVLNFAKVNVVYQSQKKDGTGEKGGEMTYNIAGNIKE